MKVPENDLFLDEFFGQLCRQTSVSATDGKWHDICVTWENNAGYWQLFKNGDLIVDGQDLEAGI